MKNVIFTSTDSKYGDFLVNNWYRSLKENTDLKNTDVVVLDFGMTPQQLDALSKENVIVKKCVRNGHVTCLRWRDMESHLKKNMYNQVLATDGGDIIFQDDLRGLFETQADSIRAVCEDINVPFEDIFTNNFFSKSDEMKIKESLRGKKMINAGVIVAPRELFLKICSRFNKTLINKNAFGPEQVAVNYILDGMGYRQIDRKYNFVITSSESRFYIKDGVFYLSNGEKIKIVHNAGMSNFFRPIRNFGYGHDKNQLKWITYHLMRWFYKSYLQLSLLVKK